MRRLTGTLPLAEYLYQTYVVGVETGVKRDAKAIHLPQGTTLEDLFRPEFWANYAPPSGPLRVGYLVRVAAQDSSFDVMLKVTAVDRGAVKMQPWPFGLDKALAAYAKLEEGKALLEPVKVFGKWTPRIDYTKANGWRVIALDGTVHSDGYTGEISAQNALTAYVKKLGYKALGPVPREVTNEPEVEPERSPAKPKKEAA